MRIRSPVAAALIMSLSAVALVATEFVVIGLAPAMETQLGLSPAHTGWLVTLFALSSALAAPFLMARLADASASLVLGATLVPFAINTALILFPRFEFAAVLRILQGPALPVYMSVASVHLARVFGPGRGIGIIYLGVTIGVVAAPPFGTIATEWYGWQMPIVVLGILSVLAMILSFRLSIPKLGESGPGTIRKHLLQPGFVTHLLLSAMLFSAMFAGYAYLATLLKHSGLAEDQISLALLVFGMAGLAGSWIGGRLAPHALLGAAVIPVIAGVCLASLGYPGHPPAAIVVAVLLVWGAVHAAGFVLSQVRVMAAAQENQSLASSMNISAANVGIALGTFTGGWALESGGPTGLTGMTALFAAASIATAILLAARPRTCST